MSDEFRNRIEHRRMSEICRDLVQHIRCNGRCEFDCRSDEAC